MKVSGYMQIGFSATALCDISFFLKNKEIFHVED